jgi:NADH:ubiquinone oxidoreductase subunit 6 (subunit J)
MTPINNLIQYLNNIDNVYFTPWWFSLAFILGIFLFVLPVHALLSFLSLTIVIAIGILIYLQNEFFTFLVLFIYSGAITVLFIFLLQFYNINYEHKQINLNTYNLPMIPIVSKGLIGMCVILLFTEISSIFLSFISIDENWELINNQVVVDESLIKNLGILFLANHGYGNIIITVGCILLVALIVVLCIIAPDIKKNV